MLFTKKCLLHLKTSRKQRWLLGQTSKLATWVYCWGWTASRFDSLRTTRSTGINPGYLSWSSGTSLIKTCCTLWVEEIKTKQNSIKDFVLKCHVDVISNLQNAFVFKAVQNCLLYRTNLQMAIVLVRPHIKVPIYTRPCPPAYNGGQQLAEERGVGRPKLNWPQTVDRDLGRVNWRWSDVRTLAADRPPLVCAVLTHPSKDTGSL